MELAVEVGGEGSKEEAEVKEEVSERDVRESSEEEVDDEGE